MTYAPSGLAGRRAILRADGVQRKGGFDRTATLSTVLRAYIVQIVSKIGPRRLQWAFDLMPGVSDIPFGRVLDPMERISETFFGLIKLWL
jgi:hypothetical protein